MDTNWPEFSNKQQDGAPAGISLKAARQEMEEDRRGFGGDEWWGRSRNPFGSIWKTTSLSPKTQRHLVTVYSNLSVTTVLSALACLLYMHGWLPDLSFLPFLLSMGLLFGIASMSATSRNRTVRTGMLYGFGVAQGWGIAPMVDQLLGVDPQAVLMALTATLLAFVSFTASAVASPRRSQLYLGGFLGSLLLVSAFLGLANVFFQSSQLFMTEIYLGLFIFCGYILYDTQLIIERADMYSETEPDAVIPAVQLYTDFVAIFVRMLVILGRRRQEDEKRQRRRRR